MSATQNKSNNIDPYLTEDEHTTYSNGVMNTVEAVVDSLVKTRLFEPVLNSYM